MDDDTWSAVVAVLVLLAVIGLFAVAIVHDSREDERLMAQCMKDNRKEYECRAMLKSNYVPVPIVVSQ